MMCVVNFWVTREAVSYALGDVGRYRRDRFVCKNVRCGVMCAVGGRKRAERSEHHEAQRGEERGATKFSPSCPSG